MIWCVLLLLFPFILSYFLGLRSLITDTLFACARMVGQLFLVGILLRYIFTSHNLALMIVWITAMVLFASSTVVKNCKLNLRLIYMPVVAAFCATLLFSMGYLHFFVLRAYNFFDPRFFIVIGGMLLGNSLKCTIIGLTHFYSTLKTAQKQYQYTLSLGASTYEAIMPYVRSSLSASIRPTVATMASMGIIFIPGMMTGQMLGGSAPTVAIKYQIMIMVAIYVVGMLSTALAIILSTRISFDPYGMLKDTVFAKK